MSAVRVARGFTGRDRVVKFDGCYHGHADALLAGGGSGVATLGLPGSAGVPARRWPTPWSCPTTSCPSSTTAWRASIVEPVAANMGLVAPAPGFLDGLRAACDAAGALLIFDEVITGFRLGTGGGVGALRASRPTCGASARSSAAGFPWAPSAAGADVLAVLAPDGPVYQAGTLSGNPLATAAGLAVLEAVTARRLRDLCATRRALRRRHSTGPSPAAGLPVAGPGGGPARRPVLRRRARHRLRHGARRGGGRSLRTVLRRHARAGRGARPRALRGHVPRPRPSTTSILDEVVDVGRRRRCAHRPVRRSSLRAKGNRSRPGPPAPPPRCPLKPDGRACVRSGGHARRTHASVRSMLQMTGPRRRPRTRPAGCQRHRRNPAGHPR